MFIWLQTNRNHTETVPSANQGCMLLNVQPAVPITQILRYWKAIIGQIKASKN